MSANREMIEAFVNGQLSEADHDLMAHHISTCQQCATAVAAERAVRAEMAKRPGDTSPSTADFDVLPSPVVDPVDLSVPAVPELQLDFVLDRTSEGPALTLPRDAVREVALDQLPPAPSHSERRPHRDEDQRLGSVDRDAEPAADTTVAYVDDLEIAEATAAGVADSVAHAAAELARTILPEPPDVQETDSAESPRQVSEAEAPPAENAWVGEEETAIQVHATSGIETTVESEAAIEEPAERTVESEPVEDEPVSEEPAPTSVAIEPVPEEPASQPVELSTITEESKPVAIATVSEESEAAAIATATEEPEPAPTEVAAIDVAPETSDVEVVMIAEESEAGPIEAPVTEEPALVPVDDPTVLEESRQALFESAVPNAQAEPDYVDHSAAAEELPAGTEEAVPLVAQPRPEVIGPAGSGARRDKLWRWSAAAGLLVVAGVAAYAGIQVRSSAVANAAAAPNQSETVTDADLEWRILPSVLTPILDSAVYSRVLDVASVTDSLADSLDGVAYDPFAGDTIAAAEVTAPRPTQARPRRRAAERLPQIVSDPPDPDAAPVRQSVGENLPEVVTRNAPARTTARGGAVVISGVPDVPRLLRTTTHRPRPDVAYVLREYDASAAEPAPRAGVNEFRWRDATGSRLYVLSGPVGVTALRAYARRLQTQLR